MKKTTLFLIVIIFSLSTVVYCSNGDLNSGKEIISQLLKFIGLILKFFLIPIILIGLFKLSLHITKLPSDNEYQVISKKMALWLGYAITALIIILNIFCGFFIPNYPSHAFDSPWKYIITGFISGAAIMALIHSLIATRAISFFIAILTSSSLLALYFYIFIEHLRETILVFTVSFLVSSIAYVVLFPSVVKSLKE